MSSTIFYSWQSDHSKTRSHVELALKAAIKSISDNPDLEEAPRMDKDTQDVAGAVHIVDTIKQKINDCGVFLADVSLVDKASSGRSIVNQNVMFELGYAIGKHTESRVIMVANSDLGNIKDLPFDISHHRVIQFSPTSDPKGVKLQASLESAINIHLQALVAESKVAQAETNKERLISAIENDKPTRSLSEKYFESVYSKYLSLSAGRYKGGDVKEYASSVYEAYGSTKATTIELFDVLQMASEYKKEDVLLQAYKSLEMISKYYDIMPEDNGHLQEPSKDYYEFIVYEVVNLILGCIAQEKLWDLMETIAKTKLNRPDGYGEQRSFERLYGHPQDTFNYYKELKGVNYVVPSSPLIEERFSDQKKILQAYVDGSLLRYFMVNTYPWPVGLVLGDKWSSHVPSFVEEFKNKAFVSALRRITNEKTSEEFRTNIWNQASADLANWRYSNDNLLPLFERYDIKSKDDIYTASTVVTG